MSRKIKTITLIIMCLQFACNNEPNERLKEGKIIDDMYINERFGMRVEVPKEWRVITKLEEKYYKKKGANLIEKEFGENRSDTWTELIQLQKGISLNQLMITYSKYKPEIHGTSYERSKETRFRGTKRILEKNPGVKIETVRTESEIDGVQFDTFNMLLRKKGEIKGYQILFEKKYENDEVLLINIVASEREVLEELKLLLESIKLERKN